MASYFFLNEHSSGGLRLHSVALMSGQALSQVQVVDGDGAFHSREVEAFTAEPRVSQGRKDYQVVAIMGPQSSGKSTLLNYVVGTIAGG